MTWVPCDMASFFKLRIMKFYIVLFFLILFPTLFSCHEKVEDPKITLAQGIDLPQLREKGKLTVVTDFNSINYFIYKGQPMGFQYELLRELARFLDLELELKANNDVTARFEGLIKGDFDLIASNLTITNSRRELVDFTLPHSQTSQVLVQRSGRDASSASITIIRNPLELAGKTVYVHQNSSYSERLRNLEEEIGESINIVEVPTETEQLIKMVAHGEIDYTVSDQNMAMVNKTYYPGVDIETTVSFPQNQAWAVRKGSVLLKKEIDSWLSDFRNSGKYAVIYNKYFKNDKSAFIVKSDYYYPETGRISRYDPIIKAEADKIGYDWRLIASMIYQESRFNPNITSWAGAFGIMQLMPRTAQNLGVSRKSSPEAQIRAGIRLVNNLDKKFLGEIPDPHERTKFVLASYNIGYGHVRDAMNLTSKYGGNPTLWEGNVEKFLLRKSEPEFYLDPVVKYGYARGTETYRYVREIMYRYDHYLNIEFADIAQNVR